MELWPKQCNACAAVTSSMVCQLSKRGNTRTGGTIGEDDGGQHGDVGTVWVLRQPAGGDSSIHALRVDARICWMFFVKPTDIYTCVTSCILLSQKELSLVANLQICIRNTITEIWKNKLVKI